MIAMNGDDRHAPDRMMESKPCSKDPERPEAPTEPLRDTADHSTDAHARDDGGGKHMDAERLAPGHNRLPEHGSPVAEERQRW